MVGRFLRRSAKFEFGPWMLKQVQHDEVKAPLPTPKLLFRTPNLTLSYNFPLT